MSDTDAPSITHHAAPSGHWSSCLTVRDGVEIWFAGGPRTGRLGYTLTSREGADAAVAAECLKLDIKADGLTKAEFHKTRRLADAELARVIDQNRSPSSVEISYEKSLTSDDYSVVSVKIDGELCAYLAAIDDTECECPFVGYPVTELEDVEAIVASAIGTGSRPLI